MSKRNRNSRRAEAARRNGAKSRGPVTPEGKARSSQNSLKHGLTARDVVLATEDKSIYAEYRQIFIQRFQPADDYELDLVQQLAGIAWRLRRAESIETAMLDFEIDRNVDAIKSLVPQPDAPLCWFIAIQKLSADANVFLHLDRHQNRLSRQYARVLAELQQAQASRREAAEAPVEEGAGDAAEPAENVAGEIRTYEPTVAQPSAKQPVTAPNDPLADDPDTLPEAA
ncbi:MAG: hypothetical protein SFV51_24240 [Bryobacteraceae bacterium]|nr:hypothetical protein [Bryobacteraceae bacterium]